jgi:hypothetical protein
MNKPNEPIDKVFPPVKLAHCEPGEQLFPGARSDVNMAIAGSNHYPLGCV